MTGTTDPRITQEQQRRATRRANLNVDGSPIDPNSISPHTCVEEGCAITVVLVPLEETGKRSEAPTDDDLVAAYGQANGEVPTTAPVTIEPTPAELTGASKQGTVPTTDHTEDV